ncbi:YdcF family protein [Alicyclobacillus acidiphilus]|uniref:YdcF family protein n=1 Tax=Alicyclobacillus acidiphilus TaxID=182455 RepID=UPI0008357F7F|nr:YdcF family protein [Alicyclobacillus acidiphilus]
MFYLIKIIESLIVPPGLFVTVAIGFALVSRRKNKKTKGRKRRVSARWIAIALMYFACTTMVGNALLRPLEDAYPQPAAPKGDVIVVLGAGFTIGTPDVDGRGNLYGDSSSRIVTAAALYRRLHVPILLSGGPETVSRGVSYSFAQIGLRELEALGIPARMVYVEPNSRNTEENAADSAVILRSHHFARPILVTSAYHMPRAVMDFRRAGIQVTPYPTAYLANRGGQRYSFVWLPSMQGLQNTYTALREYIGLAATDIGIRG